MSDGFMDFAPGFGDDDVGKKANKFKAESGRSYRATFAWYSVPNPETKAWDDDAAWNEDGTLNENAIVRFTGCDRIYVEKVGYVLNKSPAYAKFGEARQQVATIIVVWPTDKDGELDMEAIKTGKNVEVAPFIFSTDKYEAIRKAAKRFPLTKNDLLMTCPADGAKYQKLTFTSEPSNLLVDILKKSPSSKLAARIRKDVKVIAEGIRREMAKDMTIEQIHAALGDESEGPVSTARTNQIAEEVDDLLSNLS